MTHPRITQLRFARTELLRVLDGVSAADAEQHLGPMNCISWIVGHLANQEQYYWLFLAQGRESVVSPKLYVQVGYGQPASTPPLTEMLEVWHAITAKADPYLDTLTTADLLTFYSYNGQPQAENIGTMLQRTMYHYWFHIGEIHAIRQQLGHKPPDFVGLFGEAVYQPE
jgi:uncharacterized damage-inducible protein DinB